MNGIFSQTLRTNGSFVLDVDNKSISVVRPFVGIGARRPEQFHGVALGLR